jgi:hypothetical protein
LHMPILDGMLVLSLACQSSELNVQHILSRGNAHFRGWGV